MMVTHDEVEAAMAVLYPAKDESVTEAIRDKTVRFLEEGFRNVPLPFLSHADLCDIDNALLSAMRNAAPVGDQVERVAQGIFREADIIAQEIEGDGVGKTWLDIDDSEREFGRRLAR